MGKSSIEIDVSLNMDGIQKDFTELEKKAKTGTKSVVKAVDQIATSMEETGAGAKKAGQEYEKAAEGMEESAKDAEKGTEDLQESVEKTTNSTDGLKESEDQLSRQSKKTGEDQEDLGDKTEETRQKVEKSRESFLNWGEVAQTAVKGVVIVAGTLFSAMGAGAGITTSFGTAYQQASNNIQASTGATKEEMEGLKDVMANVYADNFGEDMNDVADAVANVKKNIGGTDQEIQKATEAAFAFRDEFGYEVPESTRAAKAMMDNFGISADEAYDLMAKGAQNGLDYSGELIDNINEYSVQFGKAGLSAEDMFNIMAAGADAGAWNLDKIGDAVKELNVRLVDGSDTTKEGLKAIGMNADEVAKKMSEGGDTARETYQKVVKSLAEMDDKQAQNIAGVNLFGTMWEDLGPEVIAHLADVDGVYNDVKGTMDEINEVKYDDAKSALEALKRKAEVSLLLPISEDIMPAISSATKAATGYIDELASAYDSNGVNGLVEKAGEIFSDIATNAAEQAPRMVDVAVSFVEETVAGFQKNSGKLAQAGGDLVKAIAGAAVKALPKELQEPVEDAVDDLVDSLTDGGIKNGLKTFRKMFENGFSAVSKVTKTVLPPFVKMVDKTADNMDVLIPLVVAGATAFKGYSVINSVTRGLKGLTAVTATLTAMEKANALQIAASTGALTAKEMAVGVLTGKVTLATAATTAWNAVLNANPIALLTTGVVAASAAIAAYCLLNDDMTSSQEKLNDSLEKAGSNLGIVGASVKTFCEGIQNAGSIFDGFNDSIIVSNEVQQEVASKMDSIQSEITQIARTATEERRSLTEGEIQRIEELLQQMQELTAQELAIQQAYATAVKDSAQSLASTYDGSAEEYAESSKKIINSAYETKNAVIDKAYEQMMETNAINKQLADNVEGYSQEWYEEQTRASQERYQQAVEAAEKECGDTLAIVQQGYTDRANAGMEYVTSVADTNAQIEAEKKRHEQALKDLEDEYTGYAYENEETRLANESAYMFRRTQENKAHQEAMASIWDQMSNDLSDEQLEQAGVWLAMVAQTSASGGELSDEARQTAVNFIDNLSALPDDTREKFEMAVEGALQGIDGFDEIQAKAEEEGTSFLEALADTLEVHSPSRAVKEIFAQVNPGAVEGLDEGKDSLLEKGKGLIGEFIETLSSDDLGNAGQQAGQKVVSAMSSGIVSGKDVLAASGKGAADTVKQGMGSVKATDTGTKFGNMFGTGVSNTKSKNNAAAKGVATLARVAMAAVNTLATGNTFGGRFASGVSSKSSASRSAGTTVAVAARAAMAAINATGTGTGFGSQYASGVSSKSGAARSAGSQLASGARSGASVDGSDLGRNFGQGFANGIASMVGTAARAAVNIAASALSAAQKKIDSHSPSKETDKLGRYFGQGFVNGIVKLTAEAAEAAGQMGKQSVEAFRRNLRTDGLEFDVEATMRQVDDAVQNRIASYSFGTGKQKDEKETKSQKETSGNVYQTININQPVKSPVETSRVFRREMRRMARE